MTVYEYLTQARRTGLRIQRLEARRLSTTLFDGMYYELTYNGDKKEWYLDAYKKFENRVVKSGEKEAES